MRTRIISLSISLMAAACSSNTSTPATPTDSGTPANDASQSDSSAADSSTVDAGSGSASLTGNYGGTPIAPIMAAYWVGMPSNPAETGGGPFVYLFSGPVTCAQISAASGWVTTLPAGTQVTELLIGTTSTATPLSAVAHAAPNGVEANYATAPSATESRATSGTVTLTSYTPGTAVDGSVNVTFPMGNAMGTFHAVWCPTGKEF